MANEVYQKKPPEEINIRLKLLKKVKGVLPKAYWDAYKAWQKEIEALHKLECPNCPWDGTTIFPTQNQN